MSETVRSAIVRRRHTSLGSESTGMTKVLVFSTRDIKKWNDVSRGCAPRLRGDLSQCRYMHIFLP